MKLVLSAALAALAVTAAHAAPRPRVAKAAPAAPRIRNVIVMISDGAGYNSIEATRLWTGKPLTVDDPRFLRAAMSTYPLTHGNDPRPGPDGLKQDPRAVYDSARSWDTAAAPADYKCPKGYKTGFAGYSWNCETYPDSANTMSAMMNGNKSYNNAINTDGRGTPLVSAAEVAVAAGRVAGAVTTAQISDATPAAGGGAHAASRYARVGVADEMFGRGLLSVIGGAGNPDFSDDATQRDPAEKDRFEWIGAPLWADLKSGRNDSHQNWLKWTLIDDRARIQAIADGREPAPDRLAMIAKAKDGIAQYRGGLKASATEEPFATPVPEAQPTLPELARAALARLASGAKGFFLMIEESNTDRAAHANNLGRVIEARISFETTVKAVLDYVDQPGDAIDWSNTLLVVTADHDHLLTGPDGDKVPFQPVKPSPHGAGHLPLHQWFSHSHSNQLVPIWVYGAGANQLIAKATKRDQYCDPQHRCFGRGKYLDNTDLGRFLLATLKR
ncbi:MAG: alkaline phosphatase [Sphingomonadaceae bacterium]|nr:alkaline phosphatase [Sphingomonadaceae bacterium]